MRTLRFRSRDVHFSEFPGKRGADLTMAMMNTFSGMERKITDGLLKFLGEKLQVEPSHTRDAQRPGSVELTDGAVELEVLSPAASTRIYEGAVVLTVAFSGNQERWKEGAALPGEVKAFVTGKGNSAQFRLESDIIELSGGRERVIFEAPETAQ